MSMKIDTIKKFVEEDFKDFVILVTCDNEHKFYHNAIGKPPIIWDWDNGTFTILDVNNDFVDQGKYPARVTTVAIEEIQFIDAFIDINAAIKFVNDNIAEDQDKITSMGLLKKLKPNMMTTEAMRQGGYTTP